MSADENLTPEEAERLLALSGIPTPDPKHNTHTFLNMVAQSKDTTKLGNVTSDELGLMRHTLRSMKVASLIAGDVMINEELKDYFNKKAEIMTSTSLSKEGFLTKSAVLQRKELADLTPQKKENKSWFKKKEPDTTNMSS